MPQHIDNVEVAYESFMEGYGELMKNQNHCHECAKLSGGYAALNSLMKFHGDESAKLSGELN